MKIDLRSILLILLIVPVLNSGCRDSDSSTPSNVDLDALDSDVTLDSAEETKTEEGVPFEIDREIDHVRGNWLLYLKSESNEIPMGELVVMEIPNTEPQEYYAQIMVPKESESGEIKVVKIIVEPETLEVTFANGPQIQIFQGRLHDGIVFGNMIGGNGVCAPARLIRPKEPVLPEPHLVEGIHDFSEILTTGAEWDQLVQFIRDYPESPLLPNVFYTLVMQTRPREVPVEKIEELFGLIDQHTILWGERLKNFVRLNSLMQLSNNYRHPALLESIHTSLEGKFEEQVWKEPVDFFMQNLKEDIRLSRLVDTIRQADDTKRAEIREQLRLEAETNRFNVKLFASAAEAFAEVSDKESAIEWYLKLVVAPGLENRYLALFERFAREIPTPSSRLTELWKEVHGDEEGLQESLDREYQTLLSSYQLPEIELPDPNGKQVLIELFTGTECPPCVAADLAFSIARARLPQDRVVMLQYHLHIPAADPLTCAESSARFGYYNPSGTPTALVNGRVLEGSSGDASSVARILQPILDEVVEELALESLLEIDVKVAPAEDGTATFAASVKADEISDRWRLHVALAEGEVKFQGSNGVPLHEMVVRKLYTLSQGREPSGGSLALKGTIDPAKLRANLKQTLTTLREERGVRVADGPLDLDDLFLVVFVQDVRSRRVRQVVSVPVPSSSSVSSVSD